MFRPFMSLGARAPTTPFIARTLRLRNQPAAFLRMAPRTAAPVMPYSTSRQAGPDTPKFRYLIGIVILSSIGFYFASRSLDKKAPAQHTEADDEAHKRKIRAVRKKTTFTPDEAAVVFVLGGPGAGKGTQCANLVRDYGFIHLSAGDLLREEQAREGSEYGQLIADYIKEGKIVPQEVTIALLRNAMQKAIVARFETPGSNHEVDGPCRFLIDGFPRKMDQALKFEDDVAVARFVLFFECPEETMLKRLIKRGETSGRTDDNVESIRKRFQTFVETSMPVVEYFDKAGKVVKISCDQPVDSVYNQVQIVLSDKMGI